MLIMLIGPHYLFRYFTRFITITRFIIPALITPAIITPALIIPALITPAIITPSTWTHRNNH